MTNRSAIRKILEISIINVCIVIINFLFHGDPGFLTLPVNPYCVFAIIVSVYYGRNLGIASLLISVFLVAVPFPLFKLLFSKVLPYQDYLKYLWEEGILDFIVTLLGVTFLGMIRDSMALEIKKKTEMLGEMGRDREKILKEVRVLKTVNSDLEKRVYTHRDSTIALYSRIQEIYSFNLDRSLKAILEIVSNYIGATQCSIWQFNILNKSLELRLSSGWSADSGRSTRLPIDSTIEGWVFRNNMMFSASMILNYENLARMEKGNNIFTVPIRAGHKVWGILNIKELPFEKYNRYNEDYLMMIMELVAPALERSLEYETFSVQESSNPVTGFPPFSQFYIHCEQELNREKMENGRLSVIIVELINYTRLIEEFNRNDIFLFFSILSERMQELLPKKAIFFHYKSDNQISLCLPNLDFDGCSLLCLNIFEMINGRQWEINKKQIHPEIVLGYSSLNPNMENAGDILTVAENLLEMQKI